jgi:uncharacterized protein (DUF1778 family)
MLPNNIPKSMIEGNQIKRYLYVHFQYIQNITDMPQILVNSNERLSIRIPSADKSLLMRAAALQGTNLTEFITRTAVSAAQKLIDLNERTELTERDSMLVLRLLEDPPAPNAKLIAAAFSMPEQS